MLELKPKKNTGKTDEQIRAELNWILQRSEGWFVRMVYGFVKKLYEDFDTAEEMQKAA